VGAGGGGSFSAALGSFANVAQALQICSPSAARISVLVVTIATPRSSRMPITEDSAWSTSPARIGRV
jgi:hypothetical protein